jgi:hypothetical protein
LDACHEALFRNWKEKTRKKRYVSQHNKWTQVVFLLLYLASKFIAPRDSGFIENLGACVPTKIYSKIWGHVFTPKSRKMHRKPKTQGSVHECWMLSQLSTPSPPLSMLGTIVYLVFPDACSLDHAS